MSAPSAKEWPHDQYARTLDPRESKRATRANRRFPLPSSGNRAPLPRLPGFLIALQQANGSPHDPRRPAFFPAPASLSGLPV